MLIQGKIFINWPGKKFIESPLAREGLVSIISPQPHP
jgi:hypothetical protein